jgi:hypothetical protein
MLHKGFFFLEGDFVKIVAGHVILNLELLDSNSELFIPLLGQFNRALDVAVVVLELLVRCDKLA